MAPRMQPESRPGPVADGPHLGASDAVAPQLDAESSAWLRALNGEGSQREEALDRLHALLLRAARFEIGRRRGQLGRLQACDLDDLALQVADDAMVAVLGRLGDFRGLSRFSTWAYKFALLEAAVKVRRLAWRDREVFVPPEGWTAVVDPGGVSLLPVVRRTWAPVGSTPVLDHHFNWQRLSIAAALCYGSRGGHPGDLACPASPPTNVPF